MTHLVHLFLALDSDVFDIIFCTLISQVFLVGKNFFYLKNLFKNEHQEDKNQTPPTFNQISCHGYVHM
jgi:hypothetical protein